MKLNRNSLKPSIIRRLAFGLAVIALSSGFVRATPYASCITNSGGTISYILNEGADNVKVLFDSATVTNDLGAQTKGLHSFSLAAYTNYAIQVSKSSVPGWVKTSADTNALLLFDSGRGISVSMNARDTRTFGRVYVVNSAPGLASNPSAGISRTLLGKGLYVLNADLTDALGQGVTGITNGLILTTANTDPWKLGFGRDDGLLYVNSFANASAGTWVMDLDLTTSTLLVSPVGLSATHYDPANTPVVLGTLGNGNLTLYNVEGSRPSLLNKVAQWSLGAGPLPSGTSPTILGWCDHKPANLGVAGLNTDLDVAVDGKIFTSINRSAGTDTASVQVFDSSGLTVLWDSLSAGGSPDPLRLTRAIMLSPDGGKLAMVRDAGTIMVVALTNGIPDLSSLSAFPNNDFTTAAAGASARDLAYDPAGNIYVIGGTNASYALYGVKVYSPGGTTLAVTANDLTGTNGTFFVTNTLPTVNIAASMPYAAEDGTPGVFTISRTGDTTQPLTVYYSVAGTAGNGVDYTNIPASTNIPAAASSLDITIAPISDLVAEATETVILTVVDNTNYFVAGRTATVFISDTNRPVLAVTSIHPSMYERIATDYAAVGLTRNLGQTNVSLTLNDPGAFTFGGSAVLDVDYVVNSNLFPYTFNPGDRSASLKLVSPIDNSLLDGNRTLVIGMASGVDFDAATNTVTTTIIDDEVPAETVLFSDNFDVDSSANWKVNFASKSPTAVPVVEFAVDYSGGPYGIPSAPHSAGDTHGLHLNVNKDGTVSAAGVNLYPNGQSFGTNFAVRFDLCLFQGSAGTTEFATYGINNSGNQTNWYRNNANGWSNSVYDGLWYSVECDAGGAANAWFDYVLLTAPRVTNLLGTTACVQPSIKTTAQVAAFNQVFKAPPFNAGGSIANFAGSATPTWADVEIAQVVTAQGSNLVTMRINHTVVLRYTNATIAGSFTNGNIMLGYDDAYDSTGNSLGAIYDNLRVVKLFPPIILTQPLSAVVAVGGSTNFTVVASGTTTGRTNFQWRLNNVAIAGATNPTLNLVNIQLPNYGTYTVVVDDGLYSVTSASATLTPPAPVITSPPTSRAGLIGGSTTFNVAASTFSGVTNYQWRLSGTNLPAKTNASLPLVNLQTNNFGPYRVVVSDGVLSVTSSPDALLTIAVSPRITNSVSGATLSLRFPTEIGPSYVVEYKLSLTNPIWTPLATNAGTGAPVTVTDSLSAAPTRFYRIRLQ